MTLVDQAKIRSLVAPIFIRLSSPASGLSAWPPRFPCRKLIGFAANLYSAFFHNHHHQRSYAKIPLTDYSHSYFIQFWILSISFVTLVSRPE